MADSPRVKLATSMGDIVIELNDDKAPNTVANFLKYVDAGFYSGTIFHRVIKDFMIQGGGFTDQMKQKAATHGSIENEADNGLKNDRGAIAMARTNDPHSASCQFFINVVDNDFLNFRSATRDGFGYCVFGKVVEGDDVMDQIRAVPTLSRAGHDDVPAEAVVIESVQRV